MRRGLLQTCSTLLAITLSGVPALAAQTGPEPLVIAQPTQDENPSLATYLRDPAADPAVPPAQLLAALRQHVRYVFVLFQENESFDHYYGSFPGANGLFSDGQHPRDPAHTPGFAQPITNLDGTTATISPFLIGPAQFAADLDDIDHGHARMATKMDLSGGTGTPRMDKFALVEEAKYTPPGANRPTLQGKQYGELAMAYADCDTIPFLWNYAARFTLFDNIFQTTIGPSTPNAIAMIAGQSGETQWVKHPDKIGTSIPVLADPIPFWGSTLDTTPAASPLHQPADTKRETSGKDGANTAPNLTFASLPLTLAGHDLGKLAEADAAPSTDLADVSQDVPYVTNLQRPQVNWRWYEEGYDHEPTDPTAAASHTSYIGHHNGAQYFGYVTNNPEMNQNLKGLGDFFADIQAHTLPEGGGVIFVRGGYTNIAGLLPALNTRAYPNNPEAARVEAQFLGDDDHPGYSDSHLSEALVAREVNAIARSPYWPQSAIIITYDESEGDYDHVPPRILSFDPAGLPLSRGPRIPLTLISPYARSHATSHEEGDHASVIRLIDEVYDLPPLADLPDELQARMTGQSPQFATQSGIKQTNLGPHDDLTPGTGDLLSGFDPARLTAAAPPIPASFAEIPDADIAAIPPYANQGCAKLAITPEDIRQGYHNPIPPDFNPRPTTTPSPVLHGRGPG